MSQVLEKRGRQEKGKQEKDKQVSGSGKPERPGD
jgi:hypothetical protein